MKILIIASKSTIDEYSSLSVGENQNITSYPIMVDAYNDKKALIACISEYILDLKADIAMIDFDALESVSDVLSLLKANNKHINIIYISATYDYLRQAVTNHVSGYILKPLTDQKLKKELNNLLYPLNEHQNSVYAHTFGHFEIYVDGVPVKFKRQKSKELLALLIDRQGAAMSTEQMASYLFEERNYDRSVKNLMMPIIRCLTETLKEYGADIIVKSWGHLAVDTSKFACDSYDFLKGKNYAYNLFQEEYMSNYSWAEVRLPVFIEHYKKRKHPEYEK